VNSQPTHCFAPVVIFHGHEIHASSRLYCRFCSKWLQCSTSVGHYGEHFQRDQAKLNQAETLSNPNGSGHSNLSFVMKRGEPMSALEWFRKCPEFETILPTDSEFTAIVHAVKDQLENTMKTYCRDAQIINLAIDGWTDRRGRRYTGLCARWCDPQAASAGALVLAFKPVTAIHDSGIELRRLTDRVLDRYDLSTKVANICTDRHKMNEKAFRIRCSSLIAFFETRYRWLPCTCHFLNNLLQGFMDNIKKRKAPIFRLQQRFRKHGPFMSFCEQQGVVLSIPGVSHVRWYSTNELFDRLLTLWPLMVQFARRERTKVRELNRNVYRDLHLLKKLTDAFVSAQKQLEANDFGAGSHFLPHFYTIVDAIDEFPDLDERAVRRAHEYIADFRVQYKVEWRVLSLLTFLNPSLQWIVGRTCSEDEMDDIQQTLTILVQRKIDAEVDAPIPELAPRDYHTYFASAPEERLDPVEQVKRYTQRRTTGRPAPIAFWFQPPPALVHLSRVSIEILALLATSSSIERGFSVARHVASEWQMAMLPETLSTRLLIQANWEKAGGVLIDVLRMGKVQWKLMEQAHQQGKAQTDNHWRMHLVHRSRDEIFDGEEEEDGDFALTDDSSDAEVPELLGEEEDDDEMVVFHPSVSDEIEPGSARTW
jgi:hypothetical protein